MKWLLVACGWLGAGAQRGVSQAVPAGFPQFCVMFFGGDRPHPWQAGGRGDRPLVCRNPLTADTLSSFENGPAEAGLPAAVDFDFGDSALGMARASDNFGDSAGRHSGSTLNSDGLMCFKI